jgi:hypothetical protein
VSGPWHARYRPDRPRGVLLGNHRHYKRGVDARWGANNHVALVAAVPHHDRWVGRQPPDLVPKLCRLHGRILWGVPSLRVPLCSLGSAIPHQTHSRNSYQAPTSPDRRMVTADRLQGGFAQTVVNALHVMVDHDSKLVARVVPDGRYGLFVCLFVCLERGGFGDSTHNRRVTRATSETTHK